MEIDFTQLFVILLALIILIALPYYIGEWRAFKQAKKPGWVSLVPLYRTHVMGEVAKEPQLTRKLYLLESIYLITFVVGIVVFVLNKSTNDALFITFLLIYLTSTTFGYRIDKELRKAFYSKANIKSRK